MVDMVCELSIRAGLAVFLLLEAMPLSSALSRRTGCDTDVLFMIGVWLW
jgi:hypothetical protein